MFRIFGLVLTRVEAVDVIVLLVEMGASSDICDRDSAMTNEIYLN